MPRPALSTPALSIDVLIDDEGWHVLPDVEALAARAVQAAVAGAGAVVQSGAEVSVLLTGDPAVRALNAQWRGQDKPTNVLSFAAVTAPNLPGAMLLGDIVLAFQTVAREAQAEGKPLADHVAHLLVHGSLHLLGHDHGAEADAERMEALERTVLAGLGIPDPYRDDT